MWIVFFLFPDNETHFAGQALSLTDEQLLKVAETLGKEWTQAANELELSIADLDDIKAKHISVATQKYKMLVLWRRRRPSGEATAQDLLRGLEDLKELPFETRLLLKGNVCHPHTHRRHSGGEDWVPNGGGPTKPGMKSVVLFTSKSCLQYLFNYALREQKWFIPLLNADSPKQ